jgi:hypothetical protein
MFSQGVELHHAPTLNTMLPAADKDVKRLIASNLETVHWADMAKFQQNQLAR